MEIGKIYLLVALAFAAVAGLVNVPQAAPVVAVLGLVAGLVVAEADSGPFLLAALALALAHGAPASIPVVGPILSDALGSVSALLNAAACAVVVMSLARRLAPGRPAE